MLPISNPVLAKLKLEANFKEFEMIHLLKPHEWVCMQTFFYVQRVEHASSNWRAAELLLQSWFKLDNWLFSCWWKCDILSNMIKRQRPQNVGNSSPITENVPNLLCIDINIDIPQMFPIKEYLN